MTVGIRLAETSDAESVLQNLSLEKRRESWVESLENQSSTSQTLLACLDEKVLGFMGLGPCRDESASVKKGEIYAFYVEPEFQNLGIGKALMDAALNFLKEEGYPEVLLWTIEGNIQAQNWYESRGWRRDGLSRLTKSPTFEFNEIRFSLLF